MFKKSNKKCVFVFCLVLKLIIIKTALAIDEHQRLEIQHLKSELNKASYSPPKGVIVQPAWTQGRSHIDTQGPTKVEVTAKNRQEAEALRAEIQKAVANDRYAPNVGASNSQQVQDLHSLWFMKENSMTGQQRVEELLSSSLAESEQPNSQTKAPNVIDANIQEDEIDTRKLQRLVVNKRRSREDLVLKYIEEDYTFDLGPEVHEWEHIVHAGQEYFIGRRVTDLLVVRKDTAKYEKAMVLDVGHLISDIETYNYWNLEQQQQEGVIFIATGDKVLWYRANNETKKIELYWDWMVGNTITGLTYFSLDSKDYLVIASNQSSLAGHYALNIYQYKLQTKEFWITQRLQLKNICNKVTVINTGRDVILAIPQNNTAEIYAFNPHEAAFSHIRFQLIKSIPAEGILTIAGFKMGGHSYLALTGYQPQILKYQQGDFVSKTILGHNFGLVELFFPIPIRTYRDDLILLVQHKVDFTTHSLTVLETLIWDGEAFETSIPVPCHMGEHVVYGVTCMLDLHRDEGMKGAALLKRGDEISVIVPRFKAESGLFRFHTELMAKNSEILDLQEIFSFLKEWVKEQDDLVAQAEQFLKIPNEDLIKSSPDFLNLEFLRTSEFRFEGEVEEIYVNDQKWSKEDSQIDLEQIIQSLEEIDKSISSGRQRRNLDEMFHEHLEFDEIWVEDLEVESVNGLPYFIQNGELKFEGLVDFQDLEVLNEAGDRQSRQLSDEDFILEGDLEFDFINDLEWSVLKDNLVFKNQPQNFQELELEGEVIVDNILTINTLNTLKFPEDYMLSNGPTTSIVRAPKHFANTLSVNAIDTNGLINGKNPLDAISLMDTQEWQGMPIFKHLEVAEILELHGQVHGRDMQTLPQNPTLKETNIIEASCHFNELMVNGPVVVKGQMDDESLGSRFKDIILKSSDPLEEMLVPSQKSFDLVVFPIDFQLENSSINKIPAQDFVTMHTNQTLNISHLEGYVYFYNLTVDGTYDGVKVEEVLKEVILLDKPIDLSNTELIFPEDLKGNSISIVSTINGQSIKDNLQTLQEDLVLNTAEFEILETQQADFTQDILGSGKLNNIELHSFVLNRSWHDPPIKGNVFLNELILQKGLQTDELHGIKAEYLLDFLNQIDELPDMVLNGQIQVDHITVTGDVQLNKLNGLLFDEEIQMTSINLNRPNFLSTNLSFKQRLDIKGQLNVMADFRGEYWPDVIDDMVIRSSNNCIEIKAPKSFLKPINVLYNTQAKALNGMPMENMAWKTKANHFMGSIQLKGNLKARNINIEGNINNCSWQDLDDYLYYDPKFYKLVLKNITVFKNPQYLEDLTVLGDLNDVPDLADFFENLIYKNQICLLKGKNTFTGRVSIDKGAFIKHLNGHDLMFLFNNLVFAHGPEPIIIQAPLRFEDSLSANEIHIKKYLKVHNINDCSLEEWLNNTLRVDQDQNIPHFLQFSAGCLDGNIMSVHFIKDIDLSRVITLNTPQDFNESVRFSDVVLNGVISTKGRVNNINLEEEFKNTLMTYGNQHISKPLTIQSIVVLGDLIVRGVVNKNMNLQDVATLEEDIILESPIYFQSIYSPQVIMKDQATGINFNKWFKSALKYQDTQTQFITGNWSTKYLTVKSGPNDFQYMINGFKPLQYYSHIRSTRMDAPGDYQEQEICQLIKEIWQDMTRKSVYLRYIEEIKMDLSKKFREGNETLRKVFHLKSHREDLLLINLQCKSYIYKWLPRENRFSLKNSYKSGPIEEIEIIPALKDANKLEFLASIDTAEPVNCSLEGFNKWLIRNGSIVIESKLPQTSSLMYVKQGNNSSLWSLDNEVINELDSSSHKTKQKWPLPLAKNKTRYRFVPFENDLELLMTNGEHIVLLSNHLDKKFKKSSFYDPEPVLMQTSYPELLNINNSESFLKPNSTLTRSFVFADFKQLVERMLMDLGVRLSQQVNITQLSIPESDLFDEHLVPDFLAIMEQLQQQTIYSKEVLNISFDNITLPENPAQVLAASVVQIVWPVAVEMEEIHSYLRTNKTHDHPLCSCISKSLGFLIKDVLVMANERNSSKDKNDYTSELSNVIERIRVFEKDLKAFVKALESHNEEKVHLEKMDQEQLVSSPTNEDFPVYTQTRDDLMFVENSHLPGYKQGEILALQIGQIGNTRRLWAVTNTKTSFLAKNNPGIYLYLEGLKGQLYQMISAVKPRSLQQLRVKQETLLLYIEDCCQVKVLRYQGLNGFEKFAEISGKGNIKQILTLSLPSSQENVKHLLLVLFENDIKFYEFVIEGFKVDNAKEFPYKPSICL